MPERRCAITRARTSAVRVAGPSAGPAFTRAVLDVAGAVLTWPVLGTDRSAERRRSTTWAGPAVAVGGLRRRTAAAVDAVASGTPSRRADAARAADRPRRGCRPPRPRALGGPLVADVVPGRDPRARTGRTGAGVGRTDPRMPAPPRRFEDQLEDRTAGGAPGRARPADPLAASAAPPRRLDRVLRLIDDAADNAGLDGEALRRLRSALERDHRPTATPLDLAELFVRQRVRPRSRQSPHRDRPRDRRARGPTTGAAILPASSTRPRTPCPGPRTRSAPGGGSRSRSSPTSRPRGRGAPRGGGPTWTAAAPNRVPLARRDDVWTGRADLDIPASTTTEHRSRHPAAGVRPRTGCR